MCSLLCVCTLDGLNAEHEFCMSHHFHMINKDLFAFIPISQSALKYPEMIFKGSVYLYHGLMSVLTHPL